MHLKPYMIYNYHSKKKFHRTIHYLKAPLCKYVEEMTSTPYRKFTTALALYKRGVKYIETFDRS